MNAGDLVPGMTCGPCRRERHRFTWPEGWSLYDGCPCCGANHGRDPEWVSGDELGVRSYNADASGEPTADARNIDVTTRDVLIGRHVWARRDTLPTAESAGWRCVRCGLQTQTFAKQRTWPKECHG